MRRALLFTALLIATLASGCGGEGGDTGFSYFRIENSAVSDLGSVGTKGTRETISNGQTVLRFKGVRETLNVYVPAGQSLPATLTFDGDGTFADGGSYAQYNQSIGSTPDRTWRGVSGTIHIERSGNGLYVELDAGFRNDDATDGPEAFQLSGSGRVD